MQLRGVSQGFTQPKWVLHLPLVLARCSVGRSMSDSSSVSSSPRFPSSPVPKTPSMLSLEARGVGLYNQFDPKQLCGHGLALKAPCPMCHSHSYLIKRIKTSLKNGFSRMDIKQKRTEKEYLRCLEVDNWEQACKHIVQKMDRWNEVHRAWPQRQMSLVNTNTDHIRPVQIFKDKIGQESTNITPSLCNHHTNLQPLLIHDNSWKGNTWTKQDEEFWLHNIILCPNFKDVYFGSSRVQPSLLEAL